MRSTLDELHRELDELTTFVASIAPVNDLLAKHENSTLRRSVSTLRRFDNAAFVVALYASFEQYAESLATAMLRLEVKRLQYGELPSKLATKHLVKTADLMTRTRLGEGRLAGLTAAGLVENLSQCLKGGTPYTLNEAAVFWHESNFRAREVDELFSLLGIETICTLVRRGDELLAWYAKKQGLTEPPTDGVPGTVIEERLGDLVERRNRAAHRGGSLDDLLGVADMKEAIDFVRALSVDVFAEVVNSYLATRYDPPAAQTRLTQVPGDGPYQKGTVIVVESTAVRLHVGQPIFVRRTVGGARWGRIQGLKLDDVEVAQIDAGAEPATGIGIRVDFKCPKGASPVVLTADDDLVWAPLPVDASPVRQPDEQATG